MTTTQESARTRAFSLTAGIALGAAMFGGSVLSAPHASASCSMSPLDDQYVNLLAQNKMVHSADFNDCNEAAEGHWFANEVTNAADPFGRAKDLVSMVKSTTGMNPQQSEWEVESAIYVYAPQMIPRIKDQAAKAAPPAPA